MGFVRITWAAAFVVELITGSVMQRVEAANETVPKFFRIPVFYATDRNKLPKSKKRDEIDFGNERRYTGICPHHMYLGVAYCNIQNTEHKCFSDEMKKLGWQLPRKSGEGPDGIDVIEAETYQDESTKFFDQVHDKAKETPDKEVFMFVPGYMSTFESGLRSSARFAYYSERPLILYSWPSKGKFTQYFSDEATIEWSQDHFNDIINKMNLLGYRDTPVHSRVYAHSMGGRLVLRATPYFRNSKSVREVAVVCPDVDDGVVKHYAASYFNDKSQMLVRLYLSKRDFMLKISQAVHGGYKRLGEDSSQPLDTVLPAKDRALVKDVPVTPGCPEGLNRRLLTIDFSDVDVGTLGHRIPVEVLAGMSQQGNPGGKLKLNLITPKGKTIPEPSAAAEDKDGIVKVYKPGWKGTPIVGTMIRYRPRLRLLRTKDWSLK